MDILSTPLPVARTQRREATLSALIGKADQGTQRREATLSALIGKADQGRATSTALKKGLG